MMVKSDVIDPEAEATSAYRLDFIRRGMHGRMRSPFAVTAAEP